MILRHKKSALRRPFAVLDLGSSKITCLIGEADGKGQVQLLGQGMHASAGMRHGEVSNLEQLSTVIGKTVHAAERDAGTSIQSMSIVTPGGMPVSRLGKQTLTLSDKTVRRRDMQRLMARENDADTPDTHQAMHLQTLQYDLDDVRGIADPRGMRGSSLSVDYTIVSGARTSLTNFREALVLNHLEVDRFIHAGYAAGLACLGEEERELGGAVIDMGGGTTSISMFMHGKLIYVDTIPVGGHRVTTDIARILSLPVADAERIKAIDGSVMPAELTGTPPASLSEVMRNGNSDNIVIPTQGDNIEIGGKSIERNLLSAIIRPRIEEIIELLTSRIENAHMQHAAGNRLLLTGGASQLTGLADLYAHCTQKTAVLGTPQGVDGVLDENSGPECAAAIGALMHVSRLEENDPTDRQTRTLSYGPFERIGAWLRDNL